ncbi:MAG: hypothetical protein ACOY4I_04625 [Bacillota bacterium]
MDTNGLIDKWYSKFIRAATVWAKSDSYVFEVEARTLINCILDLAIETTSLSAHQELSSELWSVLGVVD